MRKLKGLCLLGIMACFLITNGYADSAQAAEAIMPKKFFVGTVIGEADVPCFYYPSPEEKADGAVGFFYPGAQVHILQYGPQWCHIFLSAEGYIPTSCLSVSQAPGGPYPIGYAFATFSLDDPDVDPNGFIEFLGNCDTEQPGDVINNGMPFQLIGYAGDMVQIQRGNFDGFIRRKHANLMSFQEVLLYPGDNRVFQAGTYQVGKEIPSGLYRASTHDEAASFHIRKEAGDELVYQVNGQRDTAYTVYLPEGATIRISAHGILTSVTYRGCEEQNYINGRFLCGIDIQGAPESLYTVEVVNGAEEAYYVESTLWRDKLLEEGEKHAVLPGQRQSIRLYDGEYIELHNCRLEKMNIGG